MRGLSSAACWILLLFHRSSGAPWSMTSSACNGEAQVFNNDSSSGPTCECWKSYFKNESGCHKPTYYVLVLVIKDYNCPGNNGLEGTPTSCKNKIPEQLKELLNDSITTTEVLKLNKSSAVTGQEKTNLNESRSPYATTAAPSGHILRLLIGLKAPLPSNNSFCQVLDDRPNGTVQCYQQPAEASIGDLCLSESGNPCDSIGATCMADGLIPACACKKGYRPVPGNRWTCISKCASSEVWDDRSNACADKCQSFYCHNAGVCMPTSHGHICKCPAGFEGVYCENSTGKKFEELKWITIGIGIATLLLMVLLVAVISVVCCTDKCQRIVFGHCHLSPSRSPEDLERLSCFSATARSVLNDLDEVKDNIEMTKQANSDHGLGECRDQATAISGRLSTKHIYDDDRILAGFENETYVPEAQYDLDAADEESTSATDIH